jgi:hypothetical protein
MWVRRMKPPRGESFQRLRLLVLIDRCRWLHRHAQPVNAAMPASAPSIVTGKLSDQQQSKVASGRQTRPADLVRIESLTQAFDVPVEVVLVEDLIRSPSMEGCNCDADEGGDALA